MSRRLLALLLLAASAQAAAACYQGYFQCKDGSQCVGGGIRCDGYNNCRDGSDEVGCDALPTVALPANASVTATAQFVAAEHGAIELLLCGGQHCSSVRLWGVRADGTLGYWTLTGCDLFGRRTCSIDKRHYDDAEHSPPGAVVLEVQHRPGELAVWRQGRPDDTVTVFVEADYGTLRVRPLNWVTDMPVQFSGDGTDRPTQSPPTSPTSPTSPTTTTVWTTPRPPTPSPTTPTTTSTTQRPPTPSPTTPAPSPPWPPVPAPAACPTAFPLRYQYLLVPVEGRPQLFVICFAGWGQSMQCPQPLAFSYPQQKCVWPADSRWAAADSKA